MKLRIAALILLVTSLNVSCSSFKSPLAKSDEAGAKGDDEQRPTDETEGLMGYLRQPDLVTFARKELSLTVTAQENAIVADEFDVRTLYVHIIQVPIEELINVQQEYFAEVAAEAAPDEPTNMEEGSAEMGQPDSDQVGEVAPSEPVDGESGESIDPTGGTGEESSAENDPTVNEGENAEDAANAEAASNLTDFALIQRLVEFSPAELLVKGRVKASLHPNANGSFEQTVTLTRPDPVVVVVGQFDMLEMLTVKTIDDPRVSTIIWSPATESQNQFLDADFINGFDGAKESQAVADAKNDWDQPTEAGDWGEDIENPDQGGNEDKAIEYLPGNIKGDLDPNLAGSPWTSGCVPQESGWVIYEFRYDGERIDISLDWFSSDKCMLPIARTYGYGRMGTYAIEGDPEGVRRYMFIIEVMDIIPQNAVEFTAALTPDSCEVEKWIDGQPHTLYYEPGQDPSKGCRALPMTYGLINYGAYSFGGENDTPSLSQFNVFEEENVDPTAAFPVALQRR